MKDDRDQITERLVRAKFELDEALVEIERLPVVDAKNVAFIAHALNNFLTVTSASAELLQLELAGHATSEAQRLLAGIMHTTEHMTFAVSRLTNSPTRREANLISRAVDLVRMARRAGEFYQRVAARKRIEIVTEADVPSAVAWTDDAAVAAILDNLLSNAVKYSPPGTRVLVRVAADPDAVVCCVRDQGPGLTPEDQARLFQRGVRLTPVPTGGEPSSGYGLAVAKEFVTRLGGTIWCESRPGDGASFAFRLPVGRPN